MIEFRHVSKTYPSGGDELKVLQDVDLSIQKGEFVSIMGPSGSGKSTLMHVMGCLDVPSHGQYLFRGADVATLDPTQLAHMRNAEIGFVFQNFHLLPRMTALRNVELPLVYGGVRREARRARAMEVLESLGLTERLHHYPNELSGGQKQRVAIARALANRPSLILADEPTGALDTVTGRDIMRTFQMLNEQGVTVVLITHDPDVARCAKRVIGIVDGRIATEHGRWAH